MSAFIRIIIKTFIKTIARCQTLYQGFPFPQLSTNLRHQPLQIYSQVEKLFTTITPLPLFEKRVFNTQESSWQPSQSGSRSPGSAVSHRRDPPTITNLPSTSTFNTTATFNSTSKSSASAPPVLPPRRLSGRRSRSRPRSENARTNSDPLR